MNRKNHLLAILAAVSFILATLTGCGGKTEPDIPQPTQEPVEYANLTDEESRALLSRLLENAGIDETRIRGLFDRVDQFNASVKSEWLTNGFERAVPTDTKYDPYEMQDLWAEKNGDFPGYNCRITAFSLFGEFVTVGADQPKTQGEDTLFLDLETLLFLKQMEREFMGIPRTRPLRSNRRAAYDCLLSDFQINHCQHKADLFFRELFFGDQHG